jgi:Uma2 family endonuclease
LLAAKIIHALCSFLESNNVGVVLGEAGMLAFLPGQVRVPDVSLIRWERIPGRRLPQERIYILVPDLAVEMLSPSNTDTEMQRKLHEYFSAGVRLVWYIAPETQTARAYTAEDQWQDHGPGDSLSGGDVLPGFMLPLEKLFGGYVRLVRHATHAKLADKNQFRSNPRSPAL